MNKYKFVAFYAAGDKYEMCETFEEAEKWLNDWNDYDYADGVTQETIDGEDYIAEITHRSQYDDGKVTYEAVMDYDVSKSIPFISEWTIGKIAKHMKEDSQEIARLKKELEAVK